MPFVLARYASRSDLSLFDKLCFSLQDRVETSERARAFYDWLYRKQPAPINVTLMIVAVVSAIPILMPILAIGCLLEPFEDPLDNRAGEVFAWLLVLSGIIAVYAMLVSQSPWALLLVPAGVGSLASFWFGLTMHDYDQELDKIEKKGWYTLHAS
jgi:hypothetical protein